MFWKDEDHSGPYYLDAEGNMCQGLPAKFFDDWDTATPKLRVTVTNPGPTMKAYAGTTDANGDFTVVYGQVLAAVPAVVPSMIGSADGVMVKVLSSTVSGFTVRAQTRSGILILGSTVLLAAVVAAPGTTVNVLVTPLS